MRQKNTAYKDTGDVQNRFTAYLLKAIQREKTTYLRQKWRKEEYEILTDFQANSALKVVVPDMLKNLPLKMQLEDVELLHILDQLSERDLYILLTRILDGRTLGDLAAELEMQYSSVASAYERAVQKLRRGKRGV